jgi:hypothetical protein
MPSTLLLISRMTDAQLRQAYKALRGTRVLELQFLREAVAMERERRQAKRAFCPGASPPDNSCSPVNKGLGEGDAAMAEFLAGGEVQRVAIAGVDRLNSLRPQSTTYDPQGLVDGGAPRDYEGGNLREGQTLWDRFSVASSTYVGDRSYSEGNEIGVAPALQEIFASPYAKESEQIRSQLNSRMPLRVQHEQLKVIGDAAMQSDSDKDIVGKFSSSVTNEMVSLMSDISGSPKAEAKKAAEISKMEKVYAPGSPLPERQLPTQEAVDRLVEMARETELPDGVTLFHGIKGVYARQSLEELSRQGGTIRLQKLTSTTIRPSVATQFGKTTNEYTAPRDSKTTGGEFVHENGSLASVVRIRNATRGLPIGGTSLYENEAEVVLAPGTEVRFTGESRVVFIPAGNDTGWPSATFSTSRPASRQGGKITRTLWPVTVYDAVMEVGE